MIKHFHQCFMPTNYGYNSQHAVQDFLVRSWYVIPLLKPIRLQSATPVVLWPWTLWTQRSSWLPNNASQSVNSDTSPVTDRLQSRPPCLREKMPWCTEASPYSTVCKHAGESEGFTSCWGSAVQTSWAPHIMSLCWWGWTGRQPRNLTAPHCRGCCIINNNLVI